MGRGPAPPEEPRGSQEQGAGAHGEYAPRTIRLPTHPAQDLFVVHQGFPSPSIQYVEDI